MMRFYTFVKYLCRYTMPIYFGELSIIGKENIPKGAPVIFAPNHQNAFFDAILVGANMDTDLHYLTRSDVFKPPYIGLLASLHMMPVYRLRDGFDQLSKNEATFNTCFDLLKQNIPILIFPEGNMADGHHLRPLSKGTARLAFQAQDKIDQDVFIVPTGINYFHHTVPRHRAIVRFGTPIRVRDYQKEYVAHQNRAMSLMTKDLSIAIKSNLLLPESIQGTKENLYHLRSADRDLSWDKLIRLIKQQVIISNTPTFNLPILLFSIVNLPAHLLQNRILSPLKATQFYASIKYVSGTLIFPIWWLISFFIAATFLSFKGAILLTVGMIASLFIRGSLRQKATLLS